MGSSGVTARAAPLLIPFLRATPAPCASAGDSRSPGEQQSPPGPPGAADSPWHTQCWWTVFTWPSRWSRASAWPLRRGARPSYSLQSAGTEPVSPPDTPLHGAAPHPTAPPGTPDVPHGASQGSWGIQHLWGFGRCSVLCPSSQPAEDPLAQHLPVPSTIATCWEQLRSHQVLSALGTAADRGSCNTAPPSSANPQGRGVGGTFGAVPRSWQEERGQELPEATGHPAVGV